MFEPVIGLEIHTQLKTQSKLFCDNLNDAEETHPNVNICPVCMGHPGTLPALNKKAVEMVVQVGCALSCAVAARSKFDRKNYFYPDLPKGYQISQYDMPLCEHGELKVGERNIGITRIHLEEDTGRLVHGARGASLVDFNRAGVPLMELVTEPDMRNAQEAVEFARRFQTILQYLGASDASMEKGQMRCEVNISMHEKGKPLGTKVEVKNLNSFTAVKGAIEYEIKRQSALLEKGAAVKQETRGWDENKKATVSQRLKESAHDYRYFPEPDLPALTLGAREGVSAEAVIDVERLRASLPELPEQKHKRFKTEFSLEEKDAALLVSEKATAAFFERVISELGGWKKEFSGGAAVSGEEKKRLAKLAANYLNTDLRALTNETGAPLLETKITAENFAELIALLGFGKITSASAKAVLADMFATGKDPSDIVEEKGLAQVSDAGELEKIVAEIIAAHPKVVADYKGGNNNAMQFLIGQLMAKTKSKANPAVARGLFEKLIA